MDDLNKTKWPGKTCISRCELIEFEWLFSVNVEIGHC